MHLMRATRAAAVAAVCILLSAGPAWAGLFDDEEARKAIVALRSQVASTDAERVARITELTTTSAALVEQLTALRRSLLELNNQLETMRGEIAKLRGDDEQMLREMAELQKGQKEMSASLEERLKRVEPVKVTIDGTESLVEPAEKRAYEAGIAAIRSLDFDRSVTLLGAFQRRYPGSAYADSVNFWLGNAQYGKKDYKEAVSAFNSFVTAVPRHPRAPEAMLALANSQAEMKDARGARRTLESLLKDYPNSEAAIAGKERLAGIK